MAANRIRNLADAEQLDEQETFQPLRKQGGHLQPKQLERLERSRRPTARQQALGEGRGRGRYREVVQA